MNWASNRKFTKEHFDLLTPEFQDWWEETYGPPPQRQSSRIVAAYWAKCALCLEGWVAHAEFGDAGGVQTLDFGD